jgi:hypothetical protein
MNTQIENTQVHDFKSRRAMFSGGEEGGEQRNPGTRGSAAKSTPRYRGTQHLLGEFEGEPRATSFFPFLIITNFLGTSKVHGRPVVSMEVWGLETSV